MGDRCPMHALIGVAVGTLIIPNQLWLARNRKVVVGTCVQINLTSSARAPSLPSSLPSDQHCPTPPKARAAWVCGGRAIFRWSYQWRWRRRGRCIARIASARWWHWYGQEQRGNRWGTRGPQQLCVPTSIAGAIDLQCSGTFPLVTVANGPAQRCLQGSQSSIQTGAHRVRGSGGA